MRFVKGSRLRPQWSLTSHSISDMRVVRSVGRNQNIHNKSLANEDIPNSDLACMT